MTYTLYEQWTAKNWTAAANVPGAWGLGPRSVEAITIHWWGDPVGQTFEGIVDWFCNPNSSVTTSAHYVASAGQVACIVSPDDAAWHAGNAYGNVHTIGIECNPRCSDGDYQTVAELIAYLRGIYGDIPIYPHNHWTGTSCPGNYDLARLDALSRGVTVSPQATTTTPIEEELVPNATDPVFKDINGKDCSLQDYLLSLDKQIKAIGSLKAIDGSTVTVADQLRSIDRKVSAVNPYLYSVVSAAVGQIVKQGVDPAVVQAAVSDAIKNTPAPSADAVADVLAARLSQKVA